MFEEEKKEKSFSEKLQFAERLSISILTGRVPNLFGLLVEVAFRGRSCFSWSKLLFGYGLKSVGLTHESNHENN